jgi:hypothetical protein
VTRRFTAGPAWLLLLVAAGAEAQVPAGGQFRVNTYTPGQQSRPAAAAAADGIFVIAWESHAPYGAGGSVFAQRFGPAGERLGGEFQVHPSSSYPAASGSPDGDFVVAWEVGLSGLGRRFSAAGTSIGSEFGVSGFNPAVASGPSGRSALVAQAIDSYNSLGVFGGIFDEEGSLVAHFRANESVEGHQQDADVTALPNGVVVVVWENNTGQSNRTIVGQRYDADGNPLGGNFVVGQPGPAPRVDPVVAAGPAGGFVVVSTDYGGRIAGQRFDASGGRLGGEFRVNSYTTSFRDWPAVAADARGNFVVAWEGDGPNEDTYPRRGIFARRFRADGTPRGEDFHVNTFTTGDQKWATVASDDVGNFIVSWWDPPADPSQGVSAQRFGGLRPAALAVDRGGNGVLEAGETVDVRTSWRNVNGATQAFGGTLAVVRDLRPATAQVVDGSADFGSVADGAVAECTDCYRMTVPPPPPPSPRGLRPHLHQDVLLEEMIVPDAQGQDKLWRVHVGGSFDDVPASRPAYRFVETLLHHGITGGCGAGRFCPEAAVTRAQAAVFALAAKEGPAYHPRPCGAPMFADVDSASAACPFLEELARRGAMGACGDGRFCPDAPLTREEMAALVVRTAEPTLEPPPCAAPRFADVDVSDVRCRWIEELARRGVVAGCGGGKFCPRGPVTREQMAVIVAGTFGLSLYGP